LSAPNWTDWIKSAEGLRAANASTLIGLDRGKFERFLENRLWAAFMAGAAYERERGVAGSERALAQQKGK